MNAHRLDGSAFIVLIVVLVTIIIVSFSAVVYLFRQERKVGDKWAQRRRRYNAQPLVDRDLSKPQHSKKWYSHLWDSRDRHKHVRLDSRIQTNSSEWDVDDSMEDFTMQSSENNQSGLLRKPEIGSSVSPIVGPRAYTHLMHSATSDDAQSVRYDPHDVPGMPYPEQFPIRPQATIPSIESRSHSPALSSPSSSPVSRRMMESPEPISSHELGQDSVQYSLPQFAPPIMRGVGNTKFFESF